MFVEPDNHTMSWEDLGDINEGRPNLGEQTPVIVYRLLEFTLRNTLAEHYGEEKSAELFREAGRKAGILFCKQWLDTSLGFEPFVAQLQQTLADLKIGILKLEESQTDTTELTISVYEDLDCSGLPNNGTTVCNYDEGFIAGILETFTGQEFRVQEVDCWAAGGRVCRFKAEPV